jgi:rare lipoprotein A
MAAAHSRKVEDADKDGAFYAETGGASWYGRWHNGMTAADGSSFDPDDFTAAHRTLKFGTIVQVTNLRNHRMVKVRITDRGPHAPGRIIDVSAAAARELGMQNRGLAQVRVRAFRYDQFPD